MNINYQVTHYLLEKAEVESKTKSTMSNTKKSAIGGALVGSGIGLMISREILGSNFLQNEIKGWVKYIKEQGLDPKVADRGGSIASISVPILVSILITATLAALTGGVTGAVSWINEKLQKKGVKKEVSNKQAIKMGKVVAKLATKIKKNHK